MPLLGFVTRPVRALAAGIRKSLVPASRSDGGGWQSMIREPFTGAWQRNLDIRKDSVMAFHADFACRTLIASDIAKLRVKLVAQDDDGIWTEVRNPAYSPVLRKPNDFQNRIQFFESWVLSKLQTGNTYVLKQRDQRGVVAKLFVLDPMRVQALVAPDGSVFYQLSAYDVAGLPEDIVVPSREIIHDRFNCERHPLVGTSPIVANGLASTQGLNIQNESALLFKNNSTPGGLLYAPEVVPPEDADRLKADWERIFGGENRGRIAVLGGGMQYQRLPFSAVEGQLIEQLKWTAEVVCSTYHVPPYKIGVGEMPKFTNVQSLNIEYYSQALQRLIEDLEVCLDEGLATGEFLGTEFDTDNLLRMDSVTQMAVLEKASGTMKINEKRKRLDLLPVEGGDDVYLQQQNFSLAALAKRDAKADPFGKPASPAPSKPPPSNDNVLAQQAAEALIEIRKGLAHV
jgi:HK97 family phage portal protein